MVSLLTFHPWYLAAEQSASIKGTVFDQDRSVIMGAEVKLYGEKTAPAMVQTDSQGTFAIERLEPGTYTIEVSKEGFASFQRDKVRISPGQRISLKVVLSLPVRYEDVNVGGSDDAKGTSTRETYLDEKVLHQLSDDQDTFKSQL